ncbi:GIY-YIG nuclease family protein [Candidatus Falkowbacteria bacterium]|nr:GIY-YIG nuclease family protein [Candidatus Falkowbacteria bacterium]
MFYTYVLVSFTGHDFYVGYTDDLKKRFREHARGEVASTKHRRPLKLIYYEACENKYDAIRREKFLKSGPGRKFLRKRLKFTLLKFNKR